MKKTNLKKAFELAKDIAGLDYAIVEADDFGDCSSCVFDALEILYGIESKGIWLKYFERGINKCDTPFEERKWLFVSHNITDKQADLVFSAFNAYGYDVVNETFDHNTCIQIQQGSFKDVLRFQIEQLGKSQKKVAEMLNIPLRTVENWLAGINAPDEFKAEAVVEKMADAICGWEV